MKILGFPVFEPGAFVDSLITPSAGKGRSATKWSFLIVVRAAVFSATVMTLGGVYACVRPAPAGDYLFWGAYWTSNAGLWGLIIGFVSGAKKHQTDATKDITIAGMPGEDIPPPVPVSKTTTAVSKTTTVEEPAP